MVCLKAMECKNCGAGDLVLRGGYMVCRYCDSRFLITEEDFSSTPSADNGISLNSDIQRLLQKCRREPKNARKYANLILDIDPTNKEAKKFL